jgi:hypothetical protein
MRHHNAIVSLFTTAVFLLKFDSVNAQFGTSNSTSSFATPLYIGREWGSWTQSQKPNELNRNFIKSLNTEKRNSSVASPTLLTFRVSTKVRSSNFAKFVAKTREVDPAGAIRLERMFASTDVIGQINKAITPYGLRTNNVADAYAVYWTTAWLGSQGRSDDLSRTQMIAVRNQAEKALLATLPFKSATDTQKQELAEAMLIQAALIASFLDSAKADPALMLDTKAAITQGAKQMGLDLDRMMLTPQGFQPVN